MKEPKWNPYSTFTWSAAEMRAWVDFNGPFPLWDGKAWEMKYRRVCPDRYEVRFVERNTLAKEAVEYKSIAIKLAAFCCRLNGWDGVPEEVQSEAKVLVKGFKDAERKIRA